MGKNKKKKVNSNVHKKCDRRVRKAIQERNKARDSMLLLLKQVKPRLKGMDRERNLAFFFMFVAMGLMFMSYIALTMKT